MPIGKIEAPNYDDRSWKNIVDEIFADDGPAKQLAPEWTDRHPSDPGVALVEMFAWIAESIIYRLNKTPDKHYIKLLELLNIYRDPPNPAHAILKFTADSAVTIPKATQVSTEQTETEEPIVFETEQEITLLPPQNGGKHYNEVSAYHVATVSNPEVVGTSDGITPFQVFALKNAPIYMKDFIDNIEIEINGDTWDHNSDDTFSKGGKKEYRLSPVTGEITFGSHLSDEKPGNGLIPPKDAQIIAQSYRYVIGAVKGNVPAETLTLLKNPITGVEVTNVDQATDGSDWEPVSETLWRAPQEIKLQNRAVTAEDYKYLAREATTSVGKVACLGPKTLEGTQPIEDNSDPCAGFIKKPFERCPGHVNVLITSNQTFDPGRMDEDEIRIPGPSGTVLDKVKEYLESHKVLTSILKVDQPVFVELAVEATIHYNQGVINDDLKKDDLKSEIIKNIAKFLHPISGGNHNTGWEIGEAFFLPDLFDKVRVIEGINYISKLQVGIYKPNNVGSGINWQSIDEIRLPIDEHEIICAAPSDQWKGYISLTIESE